MKKRLLTIPALLLCAALALTACGTSPQETGTPVVPLEPIGPIDPINPSDDIAASAFVGTFVNSYSTLYASAAADVFPEGPDKTPALVCNADGTFSLTVMTDMAERTMRTLTGSFTISGDTAAFTTVDGAAGELTFTMTFVGVDELRYAGDMIDCVLSGDLFQRTA